MEGVDAISKSIIWDPCDVIIHVILPCITLLLGISVKYKLFSSIFNVDNLFETSQTGKIDKQTGTTGVTSGNYK